LVTPIGHMLCFLLLISHVHQIVTDSLKFVLYLFSRHFSLFLAMFSAQAVLSQELCDVASVLGKTVLASVSFMLSWFSFHLCLGFCPLLF
jgi:hypothetical protein